MLGTKRRQCYSDRKDR